LYITQRPEFQFLSLPPLKSNKIPVFCLDLSLKPMSMAPYFKLRDDYTDKDGCQQIVLYYSNKGKNLRLDTGIHINEKFWSQEEQKVLSRASEAGLKPNDLNKKLSKKRNRVNQIIEEYHSQFNVSPPIAHVKTEFYSAAVKRQNEHDVISEMEEWIKRKEKKVDDVKIYQTVLNDIKELYPKGPLFFRQIDYDFKNKILDLWLAKDPPIQNTTINKRMTCLKIFLQEMVEEKKNDYVMFREFHTGLRGPKKKNVIIPTETEFKLLCNKKLTDPRLDFARDIFVLGCSTGLRFSDAIRLNEDNLRTIGKNHYIVTNIEKTEEEQIFIPLNEVSKFILAKHPDGIKKISNQKLNKALHDLFEELEFNTPEVRMEKYGKETIAKKEPKHKLMTMHSSRRFFISRCINDGQISLGNVMAWSSHTGKSVFDYIQKGVAGEDQMQKLYSGILRKPSVRKKKPVKKTTKKSTK